MEKIMLSIDEFKQLQAELNSLVDPNWMVNRTEEDFRFAIRQECFEILLDHVDWKWWSKEKKLSNIEQLKLENIDIFHFLLSADILGSDHCQYGTELLPISYETTDLKYLVDKFIYVTYYAHITMLYQALKSLMDLCGLTEAELTVRYLAKYTLNIFRQENGIKDGEYVKIWDDERHEDNWYLALFLEEGIRHRGLIDESTDEIKRYFKERLEYKYSGVIAGN